MIKVYVKKQGNYPVNTSKIKKALKDILQKEGIVSDADVSVSLVGEEKMLALANKYLKEEGIVHNVLSFPYVEEDRSFIYPPDNIIHLGDIIICYSKAIKEANEEGKLIDDKFIELVEHSALHLLGKHHE